MGLEKWLVRRFMTWRAYRMKKRLFDETALEELSKMMLERKPTLEDFLQVVESGTVFDMTTAEYNEVVEDIRALASMDKKALKNKVEAVAAAMNMGLEFSKGEMKVVLDKLRALKDHDYSKPIERDLLAWVCRILTVEYESRHKGQARLDKDIAMTRFLLANDLRVNLGKLKAHPEFEKLPPEVLFLTRDVVFDEATASMLEILKSGDLHELIHSIKSGLYQGKRWESQRRLYQTALKYADDLWAEGSKLTMNKMAEHLQQDEKLIEDFRFDKLYYDKLCDLLRPVAAKYGKLPPKGRPPGKQK
jgi:hypothetical protein